MNDIKASPISKYFKKADLILLLIILALSAAGFGLLRSSASSSSIIEISVASEVVETHPLSEDGVYLIRTDYGYNIINASSGQVWVSKANCKGGDCMNFGKISREGELILCLPHKLSVRITGGEPEHDAIAY